MRRFGETVLANKSYTLRPGAYAILPVGEQLLLTAQGEEFQLPGGGIDPGESPLQALYREVFEETGWKISEPVKIGAYRRFCYMPDYDLWAEKVCHIYVAHPVMKLGEPTEIDHEAIWMTKEIALRALANEGDRAYVASL